MKIHPAAYLGPARFAGCAISFKQKSTPPGRMAEDAGSVCMFHNHASPLSPSRTPPAPGTPPLARLGSVGHGNLIHGGGLPIPSLLGNYLFPPLTVNPTRLEFCLKALTHACNTCPRPKSTWPRKLIQETPQVNGMEVRGDAASAHSQTAGPGSRTAVESQAAQTRFESQLPTPNRETRLFNCSLPQFPHL